MKLHNAKATVFIPDGVENLKEALSRTTHLAIGAHPDDTEIMAYHGISKCYGRSDSWLTSVTVTNGAGSARAGIYADFTDQEMRKVRMAEQRKAACVGEYAAQIQLDYESGQIRDPSEAGPVEDLLTILKETRPGCVYLHNPADKHETHVAVLVRSVEALRRLPPGMIPGRILGCEIWRDLDWMMDDDKVLLAVSDYPNLAASLIGLFDSQISGGKRYDLATAGRRLANATYLDSHSIDEETALTYAIDLTPVILDHNVSLMEYTLQHIERFRDDVENRLKRLLP